MGYHPALIINRARWYRPAGVSSTGPLLCFHFVLGICWWCSFHFAFGMCYALGYDLGIVFGMGMRYDLGYDQAFDLVRYDPNL